MATQKDATKPDPGKTPDPITAAGNAPITDAPAPAAPPAAPAADTFNPDAIVKAEAVKGNRYDVLFAGGVQFKISDSDRVYTSDDGKMQSKQAANVIALFDGGFAGLRGTVYLKKPRGGVKFVDFTLMGQRQASCLAPLDDASKAEFADWKRRVAGAYLKWRAAQPKTSTVVKTSTGVDASALDDDFPADEPSK